MTKQLTKTNKAVITIILACFIYAVSAGVRSNYGIMLNGLLERTQLTYQEISLVMGIGQLSYGFAQPVFGYIALKKSNQFVLTTGLILMFLGLVLTPLSTSFWTLLLSLGILLSTGTGVLCFGIIMGLIAPFLERSRAAHVSGILNASSGAGSSILSPLIEFLVSSLGILGTMWILGGVTFTLLPITYWLFSKIFEANEVSEVHNAAAEEKPAAVHQPFSQIIKDRNYQYLLLGFGTCGFHMAIIQTHFFSQVVSYGISEQSAAWAYTAFGLASMAGSILCGILCSKFQLKNVLASLYGARALAVLVFIFLLPKTVFWVFLFAIVLGISGDATVTPTSEIIHHQYGAAQLGFLFGVTYVTHQIGSFLSAWLGGIFVTASGDYHSIWLLDAALCVFAFGVSYLIRTQLSPETSKVSSTNTIEVI